MTYSSSLAMNNNRVRGRVAGRNQNSVSFRAVAGTRTLGPISNTITLIVLACLLGLLYLTQVTKTNAYGYQINALQQEQTTLKNQHDDLEVSSARMQSMSRVADSTTAKSMVSVAPTATVKQ